MSAPVLILTESSDPDFQFPPFIVREGVRREGGLLGVVFSALLAFFGFVWLGFLMSGDFRREHGVGWLSVVTLLLSLSLLISFCSFRGKS